MQLNTSTVSLVEEMATGLLRMVRRSSDKYHSGWGGAHRGRESFNGSGTNSLTGERDGRYDELSMAASNAF